MKLNTQPLFIKNVQSGSSASVCSSMSKDNAALLTDGFSKSNHIIPASCQVPEKEKSSNNKSFLQASAEG